MAKNNQGSEIVNWKEEAKAVIRDVEFGVNSIFISDVLPSSSTCAYLNIETKENKKLCVEMSSYGFQVVAESFDTIDSKNFRNAVGYETPYSLLDTYSPQYRYLFGNALADKLSRLQN